MTDHKLIRGRDPNLFEALKAAGLADEFTRRVVIDIDVNQVVKVYIEKFADQRVINVLTTLEGIELTSITGAICGNCGHKIEVHGLGACAGTDGFCLCKAYVAEESQ